MWILRVPAKGRVSSLNDRQDVGFPGGGVLAGGEGCQLRAGLDAQLAVDRGEAHFHSPDGDVERGCDFLVAHSSGHHLREGAFVVGQHEHGRVAWCAGGFNAFVQQQGINVLGPGIGAGLVKHHLGPQQSVPGIPQPAEGAQPLRVAQQRPGAFQQ